AQNYTFIPGSEYYGTLEMDMYTEHYMYIGHDIQDSAYITWRLVENTCPEEWDIQACDYQHCYTGLPNYGDMSGVAAGGQGYLRMIVNPFSAPGSGMLHFLIYPTGEPLNYTDAYYYFQTTVLNTENASPEVESAIVRANEIMYAGPTLGQILLFDYTGKCVSVSALNTVTQSISIESLPAGIYLLKAPTGNTFRILKPY
ncbi:MAG: T9SS type A sorting domain-containing protein, partial [Flavobacteriales bacterium]